ncbi:hypothetical protein ACL7TT_19400 [Microbulbifer sp. 2304DJ12-6]|uniref:hypothetical protein n=1 Tax=Microbulbifer sp. 2304DJ12-6 TaxID=3233340 RepID=UPI0039AFFC3C
MVDEIEFDTMEADRYRNENFECDRCDRDSGIPWRYEIDNDTLETLKNMQWLYEKSVLLCDECKVDGRQ